MKQKLLPFIWVSKGIAIAVVAGLPKSIIEISLSE